MLKLLEPFMGGKTDIVFWFVLATIVIMAIVGPLLVILSLNTLFNLIIPYNLQTWSSVVVLHAFLNIAVRSK